MCPPLLMPDRSVDLRKLPQLVGFFQDTRHPHHEFLRRALPFEPPLLPGVEPSHRIALLHVEVLCVDSKIPGTGDVVAIVLGSAPTALDAFSWFSADFDKVIGWRDEVEESVGIAGCQRGEIGLDRLAGVHGARS